MSIRFPKQSGPQLFKEGYNTYEGRESTASNLQACSELAEIGRTSLGPNGRKKIVVNHLDKVILTGDIATILRELEVQHPAAKLLAMATQQQEQEVGDGTNFVLTLAGELLKNAEKLFKIGMHPSEIAKGYEIARDKCLEILDESGHPDKEATEQAIAAMALVDPRDRASITRAVRTAISSKQYGFEDLLSKLVVDACLEVMPAENPRRFNVDSVRVVKIMGSTASNSSVVKGMVFGREPEGIVTSASKAKVAIFSCPLDISQTETKGTVLIKNADEILNFSKSEEADVEKQVKEMADAGVKVAVSGNAIGNLFLHYLNRYGIMVLRVASKFDLRRLCRVTGATALARVGAPMPEEMGFCDVVESIEIGGDRVTVFRQESSTIDQIAASRSSDDAELDGDSSALTTHAQTVTIVLRGATKNLLDDMERAIDDGVNAIKALLSKDRRLVPGAGATEIAMATRLLHLAEVTPGLSQHAIKKFAEALEVFPRTLAENAGLDPITVVAHLYAAHSKDAKSAAGVDVENDNGDGVLADAMKKDIVDLLAVKQWGIRYATGAAITVLKVDAIIMSKPAGGPKVPKQQGHWDDQD